jgi:5-methylcytosine-specific restriction enzyme subunit McrC
VLIRSARTTTLPTEEFADPGVMDLEVFFLHAERFIKDLSREIVFGLRCGYVPTVGDLRSLRGTLDMDKIALSSVVSPDLIPCKFEEFEENTLHNQILRRAVVIIRSMLVACELDERSRPLITSCDELLELLARVADVALSWPDIACVEIGRLEARYHGIFHYAKLLIKCVAPIEQGALGSAEMRSYQSGFSQVWDAAILYERHIANYLERRLKDAQKRKRKIRYRLITQKECARKLVRSSDGEFGYYEILPDIIIWDELEGRAHLIIDTKWKKHDGSMSDARQADAYQVHAYSTTYSKRYKTASGLAKTYYPPVCLLYPVIGQAGAPLVGEFTGTGSDFLLASAPMDQEHFEFDPAVVLGDCWPK